MNRDIRTAMVLFLIAVIVACSDGFGLVGPRIALTFGYDDAPSEPVALRLDIGGRQVQLAGAVGFQSTTRVVFGPRYGETRIRVALLNNDADTLATLEFNERYDHNASYWVTASVSDRRPVGFCFGALKATPLRNSNTDTLFVTHGGLPHGAIC